MKTYKLHGGDMVIREEEGAIKNLLPGVASVNSLVSDFWDTVYYDGGINLTQQNFQEEFERMNGRLPSDDEWEAEYSADEETWLLGDWNAYGDPLEEEEDGYRAILSWLGGAAIVTVVSSHWWTNARMCSPCCPGQANLDQPDEEYGYQCYSLPPTFYSDYGGEVPPQFADAMKGY